MADNAPSFTWDPGKSEACLAKRGFDFALASGLFEGPTLERADRRLDYGETRIQAIGRMASVRGRLHTARRGETHHLRPPRP
jgi:uncharacterized DUF497 family protein